MKTKNRFKYIAISSVLFFQISLNASAQEKISLEQSIDKALINNKLYQIKGLQVEEKKAKINEDRVKLYPVVSVSSAYQYNANIGQLGIPAGSLGVLPLPTGNVALPNNELNFDLGKHHTFNVGASAYQPISQLDKIKTGIKVAEADVEIASKEKVNASLQIRQGVERLYYGILINRKQNEEALAKLELAKMRLYDVESAKMSGKTIEPNESGLQANIADEEQNLLKLEIQLEDYMSDFKKLTGLEGENITLEPVSLEVAQASKTMEDYKSGALENNVEIQLAELSKVKSELGIKAAKLSNRPDFGILAGYTYQVGNVIFPQNNPFLGASLKWNIQDLFSNKEVLHQRVLVSQQAQTLLADKKDEINYNVEKAYRKILQAKSLVQVAERAYTYRLQELKVQKDREFAGLNTKADVLNTKSQLAKSEADLFAAQLSYRLAVSDLQILTDKY